MLKNSKDGYSSVLSDICSDFEDLAINQIRENREMIRTEDNFRIVKYRIKNSGQKEGKSAGFRLIYIVSNKFNEVAMCFIYPKKGKLGQDTISANGIKNCIKDYLVQRQSRELICHDINNNLQPHTTQTCNSISCEFQQNTCIEE